MLCFCVIMTNSLIKIFDKWPLATYFLKVTKILKKPLNLKLPK